MAYFPYGGERTSTSDGREKFGTYTRDGAGQDYADQRYYDYRMGRFWSPDPGPHSLTNPHSWNRYLYGLGNPVNRFDPNGATACGDDDDEGECEPPPPPPMCDEEEGCDLDSDPVGGTGGGDGVKPPQFCTDANNYCGFGPPNVTVNTTACGTLGACTPPPSTITMTVTINVPPAMQPPLLPNSPPSSLIYVTAGLSIATPPPFPTTPVITTPAPPPAPPTSSQVQSRKLACLFSAGWWLNLLGPPSDPGLGNEPGPIQTLNNVSPTSRKGGNGFGTYGTTSPATVGFLEIGTYLGTSAHAMKRSIR